MLIPGYLAPYIISLSSFIFSGTYFCCTCFYVLFFLAVGRVVLIGILAVKQYNDDKKIEKTAVKGKLLPPVSIIVPGYNEEVTAIKTIQSLLKTEYSSFEIIFIDDGSKDKTYELVNNAYGDHPLVQVLTTPNGGQGICIKLWDQSC